MVLVPGFWFALWTLSSQTRKNLNAVTLFAVLLLLVPFLLTALYFVGKALERYGYSREDIKRLPEIIEKTHGRLYLSKEIFNIIGKTFVFWGLFASALMMTGDPVKGILNGVAIFARIFAFFVLLVSMVIWVMGLPFALYELFKGKEPNRGFLIELTIRQNLFYTAVLVAVRLIALHSGYSSGGDPIGELMAFGRKTELVTFLLELSGLNLLFGLAGLYGPKKSRKLAALILTLIVVAQLWVAWRIVLGGGKG
ncbi:hypothetical protein [Thermococcus thioreducens]|uniref:Uncharacterized protein n=1 Tax=Thermococcus thioreducens TaxID=277988 RepID=A0A1I0NT27_9EURY|nr:hypothetical protein [Thermococcus thioreducens]SEW04721.1 hypothetical protein SAMN05216170_1237 [Thermococcus thioreducens]